MSFDLLAPHYRWMECVLAGRKLHDCRIAFLAETHPAKNILIMGEGNGRFLAACVKRFPEAKFTCVDASERMLQLARKRVQKSGLNAANIYFVHGDALEWIPPKATFDLIVTHFFLDCFRTDQLEILTQWIAEASSPHAQWLLADFQVPSAGLRRYRARIIMWLMYIFFRLVTRLPAHKLVSPDSLLKKNGFILRKRINADWGLLHSDLWETGRD